MALASLSCGSEPAGILGEVLPEPDPTTVRILAPADGALVAGRQLEVRGEVSGTSQTSVRINGVEVPAVSGVFAHILPVEDGPLTVTVVHEGSGASDSVSVHVDALPPLLRIESPARGTVTGGEPGIQLTVKAQDEVGLARVLVAGQEADVLAGPVWTVPVTLVEGLNTLRARAEDLAGNSSEEHVNVLYGSFGATTDEIPDAVLIHLGVEALGGLTDFIGMLVDQHDFQSAAVAQNPIVDSELIAISAKTLSVKPGTTVTITPTENWVRVGLTIWGLTVSGDVTVKATSGTTLGIGLDVDRIDLVVPLGVVPTGGGYEVVLDPPTVEFVEPVVTLSDPEGGVTTGAIEGPLLESLEQLLVDTAVAQGAEALQSVVSLLGEPHTTKMAGLEVTVDLTAVESTIAEHGIELRLSGAVTINGEPVHTGDDPGVLRTPGDAPYGPRGPDVALALSDDLVSTILHGVWRMGVLDVVVDQAMLDGFDAHVSLVAGFLGGIPGEIGGGIDPETPITVSLEPRLQPVVARMSTGSSFAVALGDLALAFRTAAQTLVTGWVSARLAMGARAGAGKLELVLLPFETAFDMDTDDDQLKRSLEASVEPVASTFLSELAPLLQTILTPISLPELVGFVVAPASLGDDGTKGAYLVVRGVLERKEE